MNPKSKFIPRSDIAARCEAWRAQGRKIVFTNGCFDILHVGHVELLHEAKGVGDVLIVGLNSDASVRRLKGESRPIHPASARARVLSALADVDAVCVFEEDTPVELIAQVKPDIHVKGGDYRPDDLPEAATVRAHGGEIVIVRLREGYSSTFALAKRDAGQNAATPAPAYVLIPARHGSTRFPGKPLAELGDQTVIERVARAARQAHSDGVIVATDDARIAQAVAHIEGVEVAMTSPDCHTGTDRLAEVARARGFDARSIVVNVQGDEPFVDPAHISGLIEAMRANPTLPMATLATPLRADRMHDPNSVKVVCDTDGFALYFSRAPIPFYRDGQRASFALRHLGLYAYTARWLAEMASLLPTPLEEAEKLEQLRALEHGVRLKVVVVENVVDIAIDTPEDLERAREYLRES